MAIKKKLSFEQKESRRIMEAEKANLRSRYTVSFSEPPSKNPLPQKPEISRNTLPVQLIKKDMVKNAFYMVLVVVVLVGLKISGISL